MEGTREAYHPAAGARFHLLAVYLHVGLSTPSNSPSLLTSTANALAIIRSAFLSKVLFMMDITWNFLVSFFFGILLWPTVFSSDLQCKDENNKPVDWFVAIKLPHLKSSKDLNVREGVAYVFITSESITRNWTLSTRNVRDSNSIMGNTLKPLYSDQVSNFARILYNDEPPHGDTTMTLGHTKGVAFGDRESGLWLIHSVPHYPPEASNNEYSYPNTGVIYGQSFLCVTVPPKGLETIGQQLTYNEPNIYDAEVPDTMNLSYPWFAKAANGERVKSAPWFKSAQFSSYGGQSFISYAKSKHFGKDLYADWLAQDLKTNLLVETWNHGPGSKMQSECGKPYKVENVEGLSLDSLSFRTGEDHSKWAVSSGDEKPWVCIGDINRMEHQRQRGGGTVCLEDSRLYHAYHDSVISLDVCPASIVFLPNNTTRE